MNTAQFLLSSMEKTASRGMVMAAIEAATGAAVGGTLGLSQSRKGRSSEPMGSSDFAGAAYGGLLGAVAGASAGALMRDAATQRGIRADRRLKSLAEQVTGLENRAEIAKANLENWNTAAVRDLLYSQNHPGHTYSQIQDQRNQLHVRLKRQIKEKNNLKQQVENLRKRGLDTSLFDAHLSDLHEQIQDTQLVRAGMAQRLTEISNLEKGDRNAAKTMLEQYNNLAKTRKQELEAYQKVVEQRERALANSKFMGIF